MHSVMGAMCRWLLWLQLVLLAIHVCVAAHARAPAPAHTTKSVYSAAKTYRINCGGPKLTDGFDRKWAGDEAGRVNDFTNGGMATKISIPIRRHVPELVTSILVCMLWKWCICLRIWPISLFPTKRGSVYGRGGWDRAVQEFPRE